MRVLESVLSALGAPLIWRVDWQGEALDRLLDHAHAEIVEVVVRALRAEGWLCVTEASFNIYGERGSIDILAFHQEAAVVVVIEVKTSIGDVQAMLSALDRKARLASGIAASRGWEASRVAKVLVVRGSSSVRSRIGKFEGTFQAFPDRTVAIRRFIHHPKAVRFLASGFCQKTITRSLTSAASAYGARIERPHARGRAQKARSDRDTVVWPKPPG